MSERDPLSTTLDALVPPFEHVPAEWDDVLQRADRPVAPPPPRRFRRSRALALAGVAVLAAISLVALVDPFAEDDAGVLDRALAAVGDGPVLHVVTRSGGVARWSTSRAGAAPRSASSRTPGSIRLAASGRPSGSGGPCSRSTACRTGRADSPTRRRPGDADVYSRLPNALRDGRARIVREGSVAGTPVYWLRVELPRPAPRGSPADAGRARTWPSHVRPICRSSCTTGRPCAASASASSSWRASRPGPVKFRERPRLRRPGVPAAPTPEDEPSGCAATARGTARLAGAPRVRPPLARIEAGGERGFRFNGQMRRPRFEPPTHVISLVFGGAGRVLVVNQARRPTWGLQRGTVRTGQNAFRAPAGYAPRKGSALLQTVVAGRSCAGRAS